MKKDYPGHFQEPIRIQIAVETIHKELKKLLLSIPKNQWSAIKKDIISWFDGQKSELAGVLDFWNGFEGITQGFKLKNILPYLTAKNINWQETIISVDKINFTTHLPIYEDIAKVPFSGQVLIDFVSNPKNKNQRNKIKKDSDKHAISSLARDNYRIIVIKKDNNNFYLLDGHRRVIKKIIYNQKSIKAYCGIFTTKEQTPKNYWISTGFLRNLMSLYNQYWLENDFEMLTHFKQIFKSLLKEFEIVRIIFPKRVINKCKDSNLKKELKI